MSKISIIFLLLILIPHTIYYQNTYKKLTLQITALRALFAPTCFWQNNNSTIYKYSREFPILYLSNTKYIIPTDIEYIKQILELTPSMFKHYQYKYNFFKRFIGYNIDNATGCPWKSQRVLNETVLITNYLQKYATYYNKTIRQLLEKTLPQNYKEFKKVSKYIIQKIVFNKEKIPSKVSRFLIKPNKLYSIIYKKTNLSDENIRLIRIFILNELHFSKPLSLLSLCKDTHLTKDELIEKIPPWIFPIASLIHTNVPQILAHIINNNKLNELRNELQYIDLADANAIYDATYLRQCILETLRLQCAETGSIRILAKPFTYNKDKTYYKYSKFILLNRSILHNEHCFKQPFEFIPERWNTEKEKMYASLIFNQGSTQCPWKHIAILIMSSFIAHYLELSDVISGKNTIISSGINNRFVLSLKSIRK